MKKITAFLVLLSLPLLCGSSCKKRLSLVATIDKTAIFTVDPTGPFSDAKVLGKADVLAALDLPDDARITDVAIESLALRVVVKAGNEASALTVSGEIYDVGQQKSKMFENYLIPLAGADVPFFGLNALIAEGIAKLRSKLNGYVKNLDNSSFIIEVRGDSSPAGKRILVDLHLQIKATVNYETCRDVLFDTGLPDCDGDQILGGE